MKTEIELKEISKKMENLLDEFCALDSNDQDKVLDLLEGKYKVNSFTKGIIKKALRSM